MEENMSSDSEMSRFSDRHVHNTALVDSIRSCPPYCEKDCGNTVTSEVDITWYFGCAIRIPLLRVQRREFEGL